jgi:hypothetical protein
MKEAEPTGGVFELVVNRFGDQQICLILCGGHAVPGLPRRAGTLLPDGRVPILSADGITAYQVQPVSLTDES